MWTETLTGKKSYESRGRDWRDSATSRGPPSSARNPRSWQRQEGPPLEPPEAAWPCWHFDLRPLASRTERGDISVVLSPLVCGPSQQPQDTPTTSHKSPCLGFFNRQKG